jgi:hypothetical protein
MVQDWYDEFLDWDSREYGHINKIILPYRVGSLKNGVKFF